MIEILSKLSPDASLDDIRYEFETIFGILEGIQDSEQGRTHSHAEVLDMVRKWRSNATGRAVPAAC